MVKMSYYTDGHNVDEDGVTVCNYGGWWSGAVWDGITCRHVSLPESYSGVDVASRYCINRTIQKKNKHHSPSLEGE